MVYAFLLSGIGKPWAYSLVVELQSPKLMVEVRFLVGPQIQKTPIWVSFVFAGPSKTHACHAPRNRSPSPIFLGILKSPEMGKGY